MRKCPYCDFNSHESARPPESEYVRALLQDLKEDQDCVQGRVLQSIFFGGGTPSLFQASSIEAIIRGAKQNIGFAPNIEITLEANPGTAEYGNLAGLRQAGVNRLSFGVQSFSDEHLQRLGRIHSGQEAITAINHARRAGFDNINLDLMHGLPQQRVQQACDDIQQALALAPEHLSWYQLTLEPNTVFYKHPPTLPVDDALADIQDAGHELLSRAGLEQYEVSAYSRGYPSRHNLNYWQFGDYLAIGAGAHGKISFPNGLIERYRKTRLPADYLNPNKPFCAGRQPITAQQLPLEFMMNALRLTQGVPRELFKQRTGLGDEHWKAPLESLIARGLMEDLPERLCASTTGLRYLNDVLRGFM